jgi:hypothetical protein
MIKALQNGRLLRDCFSLTKNGIADFSHFFSGFPFIVMVKILLNKWEVSAFRAE